MSSPTPTPADAKSVVRGTLSENQRRIITLLLMFHLTGLAIAILTNASPVSTLMRNLSNVPMQKYFQLLHLNSPYNFYLTDGMDRDFDHFIELEVRSSATESEKILLPTRGLQPLIRRQRLQQLALLCAPVEDQELETEATLPAHVATGMLRTRKIPPGTHLLRIVRHEIVPQDQVANIEPAASGPYHPNRFTTVYEADVLWDGTTATLNKRVAENERAEVRRPTP